MAKSTAEAEYVAACEACMEGQGLRKLLIEVFSDMDTKYRLGIDNQAAFVMATNPNTVAALDTLNCGGTKFAIR